MRPPGTPDLFSVVDVVKLLSVEVLRTTHRIMQICQLWPRGARPRGGLYLDSLEEVAPLLAWDILMTKFLWQPEGEIAPVWASIVHFRAGSKWITQCR
jgi:hypothetical protein